MGVLGHGDNVAQPIPKRVDWFHRKGYKVVKLGCGGHVHWNGGFTLYLLDDNRLFYTGNIHHIHNILHLTRNIRKIRNS